MTSSHRTMTEESPRILMKNGQLFIRWNENNGRETEIDLYPKQNTVLLQAAQLANRMGFTNDIDAVNVEHVCIPCSNCCYGTQTQTNSFIKLEYSPFVKQNASVLFYWDKFGFYGVNKLMVPTDIEGFSLPCKRWIALCTHCLWDKNTKSRTAMQIQYTTLLSTDVVELIDTYLKPQLRLQNECSQNLDKLARHVALGFPVCDHCGHMGISAKTFKQHQKKHQKKQIYPEPVLCKSCHNIKRQLNKMSMYHMKK